LILERLNRTAPERERPADAGPDWRMRRSAVSRMCHTGDPHMCGSHSHLSGEVTSGVPHNPRVVLRRPQNTEG